MHFRAVCQIVMATWEKGRRGKKKTLALQKKKGKEKKNKLCHVVCRLGEVVEQAARHQLRETKPEPSVSNERGRACVSVFESADWKNVGFSKKSQCRESM